MKVVLDQYEKQIENAIENDEFKGADNLEGTKNISRSN